MANPTELANTVNGYNRQTLRQFNQESTVSISEFELGASMDVQGVASEVSLLSATDKATFTAQLSAASGDTRRPC